MHAPGRLALIVGTALGGPFAVFGSVASGPHTALPARDRAISEHASAPAEAAAAPSGVQSRDLDLPSA